jgi:hypothetical protein
MPQVGEVRRADTDAFLPCSLHEGCATTLFGDFAQADTHPDYWDKWTPALALMTEMQSARRLWIKQRISTRHRANPTCGRHPPLHHRPQAPFLVPDLDLLARAGQSDVNEFGIDRAPATPTSR